MGKYELIEPTVELIKQYDNLWRKDKPDEKDYHIPLFKHISIDIRKTELDIRSFGKKDEMIDDYRTSDVRKFFFELNKVYHTRVNTKGIAEEWSSKERSLASDTTMTLDRLVELCKEKTRKNHYSFATKVFSFIDPDTYPIMDKYVVNMLKTYLELDSITPWGNYQNYIAAYERFKDKYGLNKSSDKLNYKMIDQFLWTYAYLLQWYWKNEGVMFFDDTVTYDSQK